MNKIDVFDLGHTPYREAWELQRTVQKRLIDEKLKAREDSGYVRRLNDLLLFVEHPHVFTLGKSGNRDNLLKNEMELSGIDADFVQNDRGGDITYHGPGQVVAYPILDLGYYFTDIHLYLRSLEEVIIRVCGDYQLEADRIEGLTGVWVDNKKVCAMGIRCSRWVTMHGLALNVNTDLSYFGAIVPCGISDRQVTNLSELTGVEVDEEEVKQHITRHFGSVFSAGMTQRTDISDYIQTDNFRIMQ